jgi:hypothetical protein
MEPSVTVSGNQGEKLPDQRKMGAGVGDRQASAEGGADFLLASYSPVMAPRNSWPLRGGLLGLLSGCGVPRGVPHRDVEERRKQRTIEEIEPVQHWCRCWSAYVLNWGRQKCRCWLVLS